MKSKVSIIIPVAVAEDTIKRTLYSCINQDYSNIEIIVVLNGTNLLTKSIVSSVSKEDTRIKVYESSSIGRSMARNLGITYATGRYIQFLDADDTIDVNKIMKSVRFLDNNDDTFAYCTKIKYFNSLTDEYVCNDVSKKSKKRLLYENIFPINSVVFRNLNLILFRNDINYNEDWLFWVENLFSRSVFFDSQYFGGTVYITGKNTMKKFRTMNLYFVYVRSIIRNSYHDSNFIREFKNDFQILKQYFLFNYKDEVIIGRKVKRNFGLLFYIMLIIYSLPCIKRRWSV